MSINRTIIKTWIATVILHNGQTLEMEARGKTIKLCREEIKRNTAIKTIVKFRNDAL